MRRCFCIVILSALAAQLALAEGRSTIDASRAGALIKTYCLACHDSSDGEGGLELSTSVADDLRRRPNVWESVLKKLRTSQMPPNDNPRPSDEENRTFAAWLEAELDRHAAKAPQPGRTPSMRRLTRQEYQNAIRDLLDLQIDAKRLLPADESSHGFDNVTVGELSPTLLSRYVSAAQKVSRMAIGNRAGETPDGDTIRVRPDLTQEQRRPNMTPGTRGGVLIPYTFPQDGEYDIRVRLARDRNEEVEGLRSMHRLELAVDRDRARVFELRPPKNRDHTKVDSHLHVRLKISAGPHQLGVTFVRKPSLLSEDKRQPYQAHFNRHRHPRLSPAVYQVSITGPYNAQGAKNTPSRRRLFGELRGLADLTSSEESREYADSILRKLMRRAYRRPVTSSDAEKALRFYDQGHLQGGFERGVELALSSILVNPNFLFRIERDPPAAKPEQAYRISEWELASRLSFFLWSSIPDEELLGLAESGNLDKPQVLKAQVQRMLLDPRAKSLSTRFAAQWLQLTSLEAVSPDARKFPDFDENLRQAMRMETELFFESLLRENRSLRDLIRSNYTFLNERLAKHYEVPHVYGSRFRRVNLEPGYHRGGLLRQGGIQTVTSYATRTSPVLRGHWVLKNLLGAAPPPPPPNVPALKANPVSATLPIRDRLDAHRSNPACAHCHRSMDPIGFSMENYDAVGRWRAAVDGQPIDVRANIPNRDAFHGVAGLEQELLRDPRALAIAFTEKLLIYALGRGLEYYDAPAVRRIVAAAERDGLRMQTFIQNVVQSQPFQMRAAPASGESDVGRLRPLQNDAQETP